MHRFQSLWAARLAPLAALALAALAGCGGGGGGIGQSGGTVVAHSATATVTVTVPAGALSTAQKITVDWAPAAGAQAVAPEDGVLGAATCGPDGIEFAVPVSVTFTLATQRPAGWRMATLVAESSGKFYLGNAAEVDPSGTAITTTTTHFSTFYVIDSFAIDGDWGNESITTTIVPGEISPVTKRAAITAVVRGGQTGLLVYTLEGTADYLLGTASGSYWAGVEEGDATGTFTMTPTAGGGTVCNLVLENPEGRPIQTYHLTRP